MLDLVIKYISQKLFLKNVLKLGKSSLIIEQRISLKEFDNFKQKIESLDVILAKKCFKMT